MDTSRKNCENKHLDEVDGIWLTTMHKAYCLDIVSFHVPIHYNTVSMFVQDCFLESPNPEGAHFLRSKFLKQNIIHCITDIHDNKIEILEEFQNNKSTIFTVV